MILIPALKDVRHLAEMYQKEAASVGRQLRLGESICPTHSIYFGRDNARNATSGQHLRCYKWYESDSDSKKRQLGAADPY